MRVRADRLQAGDVFTDGGNVTYMVLDAASTEAGRIRMTLVRTDVTTITLTTAPYRTYTRWP